MIKVIEKGVINLIPELGQLALAIALVLAVCQSTLPLWGAHANDYRLMSLARPCAYGQFAALLLAFICLSQAFWANDFTVKYVAGHSNSYLPLWYRLAAVWGGHEGSLLLWITILGGWTASVSGFSRSLPLDMVSRVLAVMGMVSVGLLLFIILTSNPFERILPEFPLDGRDLNPLLQDFGLIVHPPMLYMGYVGFSVVFAFAIAGLLSGRLDSAWARWSRPWTVVAWSFLSIGIALGSWWAYYELGWGGWWFWDPVENASFMPWLTGTALIHSLAVTEKRGAFKAWTVLLAILAFSLSLLGTFLVRSGVLTSVHAFANDPARGLFILAFLVIVVGGSLLLFAFRAHGLKSQAGYGNFSREMMLLFNNLILVGATCVVLLGTLFPLISEALGLGKISVGPPYFNLLFTPMAFALLALMGVGVVIKWKKQGWQSFYQTMKYPLLISVILGLFLPLWLFGNLKVRVGLTSMLVCWALSMLFFDAARRISAVGWQRLTPSYKGMVLAHVGLMVVVIGAAYTSFYSVERDVRMAVGEQTEISGLVFKFDDLTLVEGPNYTAQRGQFTVSRGNETVARLTPEKRTYWISRNTMTEAAIDPGLHHDLYVALGEPLADQVWSVRIYVKPFVRWLWLGAVLMAIGGGMTLLDPRYRMRAAR